jgi:hypothetical protein
MTRAARSVYIFGILLIIVGATLIISPNVIITLILQPATSEPWAHVLGVPIAAVGVFHVVAARQELVPFFRTSIWVRYCVLTTFVLMALLRIVPPIVAAFGLTDFAFAMWTRAELRKAEKVIHQPV